MSQRETASRIRQQLRVLEERFASLLKSLVQERGPMVRGIFQSHGTRCGKPNCKCLQGDLHPTAVLVVNEEGKRRNIYVRIPERLDLQRRSGRYRSFRKKRTELAKMGAEILTLVDALLETLITPYSPRPTGKARKRTKTRPKRTP
jgi:hypothetical protein